MIVGSMLSLATLLYGGLAHAQAAPIGVLTLAQALAEADAQNPEIAAARQSYTVAQARLQQAAPQPLALQSTAGSSTDVPAGLGTLQTQTTGLSQLLSPAGSLPALRGQASAGVQIAAAGFRVSRRDVQRRIISAYYSLAGAQAIRRVAQESVQSSREFRASAARRQRAGAVGNFDVLRATVALRRAQTDLMRAEANVRSGRITLNTLIGRSAASDTRVELQAPQTSSAAADELLRLALSADPQLAQLRASIAQAAAQERFARAQRGPSLSFGAGFQTIRAATSGLTTARPSLSATISVPFIDYGTIRGAVNEARATGSVAQFQAQGRTLQVQSDLAQAVAAVESSRARLAFAQDTLGQAREGLRIAQYGYRQGALGTLDVVSARNEEVAARGDVDQAAAELASTVALLGILTDSGDTAK